MAKQILAWFTFGILTSFAPFVILYMDRRFFQHQHVEFATVLHPADLLLIATALAVGGAGEWIISIVLDPHKRLGAFAVLNIIGSMCFFFAGTWLWVVIATDMDETAEYPFLLRMAWTLFFISLMVGASTIVVKEFDDEMRQRAENE